MRQRWQRLGGEMIFDAGIFRLRKDRYEYRSAPVHPYFVLEAAPWTNVVAVTKERQVVLVRQFRHGIQEMSLEVPGGIVDEGEAPEQAAARELLEETGYEAPELRLLGPVSSNPAILDNRTFCYLAADARRVADPRPEEDEDLEVLLRPVEAVEDMLRSGEIHHSLCVCALSLFLLHGPQGHT